MAPMATSARFGDVTTRKPAFSRASSTAARSDAHTSGAPPQLNTTAAFSGIAGAASGWALGLVSRVGAGVTVRCDGASTDDAGGADARRGASVASAVAALVAVAMFAGGVFL